MYYYDNNGDRRQYEDTPGKALLRGLITANEMGCSVLTPDLQTASDCASSAKVLTTAVNHIGSSMVVHPSNGIHQAQPSPNAEVLSKTPRSHRGRRRN